MADNKIEVEISAKLDQFQKQIDNLAKNTEKSLGDLGGKVEDNLGKNFVSAATSAAKSLAPLTAAIFTVKTAIDQALKGDQIKAINAQFELLSQQAGISADILRNDLVGAADGLVDDTDLIAAANKALVELGASAQAIPKNLEVARKATSLFGGEVVQNFELINQAIATGNTRGLRQIGIIVDQQKALKEYAQSLGVTVNSLSDYGKQQAISNAITEKSDKVFANVDPNINQTKTSFERLSVSINDLTDNIAKLISSNTSGFFSSIADGINHAIQGINTNLVANGNSADATAAKIALLTTDLNQMQRTLENLEGRKVFDPRVIDSIEVVQANIEKTRLQLSLLDEERRKSNSIQNKPGEEPPPLIDIQKAQFDAIKAQEIVNKSTQDRLAAQLAAAQTEAEQDRIINEQKLAAQQGYALQLQEFKANEAINNQLTKAQEDLVIENMEQQHQANLLAIKTTEAKKQEALSKQLGATLNQGLASAIAAGVQSIVMSVRTGENAFGNFVKAVAKVMGNLAIQMGTMLIATGLGIEALKALGGGAAVAAGIGLVAVGTILSALAGGGGGETPGTGSFANGGGPGGVAGSQVGATTGLTEFNPAQQGTKVEVNIQGNVLDRRESGLEIANIIQEHFNNTGTVIVGANV